MKEQEVQTIATDVRACAMQKLDDALALSSDSSTTEEEECCRSCLLFVHERKDDEKL
jgi:hypothetical protein